MEKKFIVKFFKFLDIVFIKEDINIESQKNNNLKGSQQQLYKAVKIFMRSSSSFVLMLILILSVTWVCGNIGWGRAYNPPDDLRGFIWLLHLDQAWGMFSPRPPDIDWWYTMEAKTDNDTVFELWHNRGMFTWKGNPLSFESERENLTYTIGNHRWYKIYESINNHEHKEEIKLQFGRYICREWNSRHFGNDKLYTFKIWFASETHNLDGTVTPRPNFVIYEHICYFKPTVNSN